MLVQSMPYPAGGGGPGLPSTFAEARGIWDAEDLNATLNDNDDVTSSDPWLSQVGSYDATTGSVGSTSTNPKFRTGVFNGRACLRSISTTHAMIIDPTLFSGLAAGIDGGTMIYVGQVAASVTGGGLFCDCGSGSASTHYPWVDNNVYTNFLNSARPSWGNATAALQVQHIGVLRNKGSSVALTGLTDWRVGEVQRFTATSGVFFTPGTTPKLFVTRDGGIIAGWAGDLAWWAFIPRYLSDAEVIEWEAYLKSLFAL